jgi:hypothetical protein
MFPFGEDVMLPSKLAQVRIDDLFEAMFSMSSLPRLAPDGGLTPGQTGRLTVGRKITLTLTGLLS